jgi:hypothetical protein
METTTITHTEMKDRSSPPKRTTPTGYRISSPKELKQEIQDLRNLPL